MHDGSCHLEYGQFSRPCLLVVNALKIANATGFTVGKRLSVSLFQEPDKPTFEASESTNDFYPGVLRCQVNLFEIAHLVFSKASLRSLS